MDTEPSTKNTVKKKIEKTHIMLERQLRAFLKKSNNFFLRFYTKCHFLFSGDRYKFLCGPKLRDQNKE